MAESTLSLNLGIRLFWLLLGAIGAGCHVKQTGDVPVFAPLSAQADSSLSRPALTKPPRDELARQYEVWAPLHPIRIYFHHMHTVIVQSVKDDVESGKYVINPASSWLPMGAKDSEGFTWRPSALGTNWGWRIYDYERRQPLAAANQSQPVVPGTNSTSAAAGSGR